MFLKAAEWPALAIQRLPRAEGERQQTGSCPGRQSWARPSQTGRVPRVAMRASAATHHHRVLRLDPANSGHSGLSQRNQIAVIQRTRVWKRTQETAWRISAPRRSQALT